MTENKNDASEFFQKTNQFYSNALKNKRPIACLLLVTSLAFGGYKMVTHLEQKTLDEKIQKAAIENSRKGFIAAYLTPDGTYATQYSEVPINPDSSKPVSFVDACQDITKRLEKADRGEGRIVGMGAGAFYGWLFASFPSRKKRQVSSTSEHDKNASPGPTL